MPTHYGPKVVTDGLVLALDAADRNSYPGSGTTWTDLSGRGNNGTLVNGVGYNSANFGSLVFDGVDDRVQTVSNAGVSGANARSLCVWVYPTELTTDQFYSAVRIGVSNDGQLFEILLYNNLIVGHFWGGGFSYGVDSGKTLLNNYSYIVMTYSNPDVRIYVDGVLRGTSGSFTLNTSNTLLRSGDPAFFGHRYYKGRIPNIQLYNRALTATEISQNFQALRSRFSI
jgi:hypothetical protein